MGGGSSGIGGYYDLTWNMGSVFGVGMWDDEFGIFANMINIILEELE